MYLLYNIKVLPQNIGKFSHCVVSEFRRTCLKKSIPKTETIHISLRRGAANALVLTKCRFIAELSITMCGVADLHMCKYRRIRRESEHIPSDVCNKNTHGNWQ